jgi:hypothetical protein
MNNKHSKLGSQLGTFSLLPSMEFLSFKAGIFIPWRSALYQVVGNVMRSGSN